VEGGPVKRGLAVGVRRARVATALQEVGRRRAVAGPGRQDKRRLTGGGPGVDREAEVLDQVAADARPALRCGQVQRAVAAGPPASAAPWPVPVSCSAANPACPDECNSTRADLGERQMGTHARTGEGVEVAVHDGVEELAPRRRASRLPPRPSFYP
jgi:hypothetical protein